MNLCCMGAGLVTSAASGARRWVDHALPHTSAAHPSCPRQLMRPMQSHAPHPRIHSYQQRLCNLMLMISPPSHLTHRFEPSSLMQPPMQPMMLMRHQFLLVTASAELSSPVCLLRCFVWRCCLAAPLHLVLVDLLAAKDTTTILRDLQGAYPVAKKVTNPKRKIQVWL